MTVRAKFTVTEIHHHHWNRQQRTVVLQPVYDISIPEDQRFYSATPMGRLEMTVNNPAALDELQLGETFYVDFTRVPETPTA